MSRNWTKPAPREFFRVWAEDVPRWVKCGWKPVGRPRHAQSGRLSLWVEKVRPDATIPE